MTDPEVPVSEVEYVGPFVSHVVVVRGRRVPHLEATPLNGGMVALHLDHRFSVDLSVADAERIVPFIADCIAVARGYASHPVVGEEPVLLTGMNPMVPVNIATGMHLEPVGALYSSSLVNGL